jgi:cyanophycin synthetase
VAIDALTQHIIAAAGYHPESVLPAKEVLVLKHSGSLRLGGAAVDVTDEIHGANCRLAERASQVVGLNVAGVDVIAPTLRSSILENGGKILEINSAPDFRMHLHPTAGRSRKVAESFMEMLFPQGRPTRVPIVSVTGSYGKAEAAGLIAHGLKASGHVTALAGSNGLQLSGQYLQTGDMTAPEQVQRILREPTIDSAVLETSVEGILGRGLGYHYAEVGIVLNLHPRKIDSDYAQDLADVAYAKSVVAEQIYDSGFAVLNAESELIMKMADRAGGRLVLFSRHDQHPRIQAHLRHGGLAAVVDRERLLICDGQQRIPVTEPTTVALLLAALPGQYALDVILAATAALYAIGLVPANIRQALASYR